MKTLICILRLQIITLLLVLMFVIPSSRSCTIFTAEQDDTVFFGNNEDWHSPNPVIGFYPPSSAGFGSIHFGFRHSDGSIEFGGAVNDQGLAWDINGLPKAKLTPHPEKTYSHQTDNYLSTITKDAASVEEAIEISKNFDFGDSMTIQIHIADAHGDGVVISAGIDGEIAFARKPAGDSYLVSTNFNLANPKNGTEGWRYETATSMLAELGATQNLTADYAGEILKAVHLENLTSYTLYSNIIDLSNGIVYVYYMAQFDEVVNLNISEELSKNQRIVELRELFSQETREAGDDAYKRFDTRFKGVQAAVIAGLLILVGGGSILVVKKLRR